MLAGFQMTARLSTNGQAGFFEAGEGTIVQVKDGIQYISHKGPHVSNMHFHGEQRDAGNFTFTWTPPGPGAGDVTFYAAAVAGEANGLPEANVFTTVNKLRVAVNDLPAGYRWQPISVPPSSWIWSKAISGNGTVLGLITGSGFLLDPNGTIEKFKTSWYTNAINSSRCVVGHLDEERPRTGFVREPDGQTSLFTIPGADYLNVTGISDAGVIFGAYSRSQFLDTLFLRSGGALESYSIVDSYNEPFGMTSGGIAYSGQLERNAVYLRLPDGTFHGASFCEAPLPDGLARLKISDAGMAVGVCMVWLHPGTGFISGESGRVLSTQDYFPQDVNNAGQIVMNAAEEGDDMLLTPCAARPVTTSLTVPREGGPVTIGVQSDYPDCRPNAAGPYVAPFNSPGSVTLSLPANTSGAERVTKIWVAGSDVTLTQPGPVCTPARLSGPELLSAWDADLTMEVVSVTGCGWTLASTVAWLTPTETTGTQGRHTRIRVARNTGPPRISALVLNGTSYRIVQMGMETCTFQVSPQSVRVPVTGGVVSIQVTAIVGCPWTTNSAPLWVGVRSRTEGVGGSGTEVLDVAANPYDLERTATLQIGGVPVIITQGGVTPAPLSQGLRFVPIASCRVLDTRPQGAMLTANTSRDVAVAGANCAVPANARAYSLQLTVFPAAVGIRHDVSEGRGAAVGGDIELVPRAVSRKLRDCAGRGRRCHPDLREWRYACLAGYQRVLRGSNQRGVQRDRHRILPSGPVPDPGHSYIERAAQNWRELHRVGIKVLRGLSLAANRTGTEYDRDSHRRSTEYPGRFRVRKGGASGPDHSRGGWL